MLLAIFPFSFILLAIRSVENSVAMFLIIKILSFIESSVCPLEFPLPFHFVVVSCSLVLSMVLSYVGALQINLRFLLLTETMDIVIKKLTSEMRAVAPCENSISTFLAILEASCVSTPIRTDFFSLAVLFVLLPFSNIATG